MTGGVPLPVQVVAAGPAQQQRVTVFFRGFMLIPHYFVLYFLGIVASVLAFLGWWGALFTGRLPEFAWSYLAGYMQWSTRVHAYGLLLTDVYPPFSLEDEPGYPVRVALPPRDTLNRAAVLFRFILVFPASVVAGVVSFGGTTIIAFFAWLIALFSGRLPTALHQAYAAVVRYQTRYNCYFYMLTAAYPGGLFGDGPAAPAAGDAGVAGAHGYTAPGYAAPAYDTPGYGDPGYAPLGGYETAGYGAPADFVQPVDWRLLLTRGARQLIGWFIGLGVFFWVAWVVGISLILAAATSTAFVRANAIDTMNSANQKLTAARTTWDDQQHACTALACFRTADATAAAKFSDFASTLRGTSMPANAVAPANRLYSDANTIAQDISQLSKATSVRAYNTQLAKDDLETLLNHFDTDNNALADALNNIGG